MPFADLRTLFFMSNGNALFFPRHICTEVRNLKGASLIRYGKLRKKCNGGPLCCLVYVQFGLYAGLDRVNEVSDNVVVSAAVSRAFACAGLISVGKQIVEVGKRSPLGVALRIVVGNDCNLCNIAESAGSLVASLGTLNLIIGHCMRAGRNGVNSDLDKLAALELAESLGKVIVAKSVRIVVSGAEARDGNDAVIVEARITGPRLCVG